MDLETIAKGITPTNVLKWASVMFMIALYILVIVSIILALIGVI